MHSFQLLAAQYNQFTLAPSKFVTKILYEIVLPREESQRCDTEAHIVCTTTRIINHTVNYIGHQTAAQTQAIETTSNMTEAPGLDKIRYNKFWGTKNHLIFSLSPLFPCLET